MSQQDHFGQCINENCKELHPIRIEAINSIANDSFSIDWLLCDRCRTRKEIDHVIQCLSCKTVLDFIPAIEGETPGILYVEKCSNCGGSVEDEIRTLTNVFKELYV